MPTCALLAIGAVKKRDVISSYAEWIAAAKALQEARVSGSVAVTSAIWLVVEQFCEELEAPPTNIVASVRDVTSCLHTHFSRCFRLSASSILLLLSSALLGTTKINIHKMIIGNK